MNYATEEITMQKKLNIMLLQGEDAGRHLGCYGDAAARTPNLDKLAAEGVRYTGAFTHSPVCAPSRGGMVTGRYPYSLGNHHMRSTLANPPRPFTQELRDAGYYVNWNTKLDFNFEPGEGWRDEVSNWYEQSAPDQPFFVYENFSITHESRMFPDTPKAFDDPPPEAEGLEPHDPAKLTVPPHLTDCPEVRRQLADYYDAYSVLDAQIGRRLQWLDEQGLRDNTVVMYLSDHGRGLPREKRWCYDAGLHLPLIIRWPEGLEPGTVCGDLVGWVDIAPTLLSLAGVPVPGEYQGQIFLGEHAAPPREYVFAGRDRMDEVFDRVRVARDHRWHYIRNYAPKLPWAQCQKYMEQQKIMGVMREKKRKGELSGDELAFFRDEKPPEELYDTEKDPNCMNNLAGVEEFAWVLEDLRRELDLHLESVRDLGEVTEEELIERGIVEDRLTEYRERRKECPSECIVGPAPFPMTLREAREAGRVAD
ncbi:MAG: sulfatase [Opitutales bacterium]